ncbi:uncharacterized protein LOC129727011 [Wyeomyia smithii]|uniref:uncharacterized protein LOC129727011 n=1 Tax=Wyeomyia smithii TaxID=174621 RepID=UPI002467CC64|nr:uncharacterized protein LOC129727011 [Wyeomyia smithii]
MAKFITLGVVILALVAFVLAEEVQQPAGGIESRIEVVQDIAAFKAANPDVDLIPMEVARSPRQQFVYTLGGRVNGDRLVGSLQDGQSWSILQDIALTLRYPQSGVGAVVSYVQVVVNQSSNLGQGYVVAGGIGQRYIQMVIEAYRTSYFNYNAQIYGL